MYKVRSLWERLEYGPLIAKQHPYVVEELIKFLLTLPSESFVNSDKM